MLSQSEIRITVALIVSMAIHGMVIVWNYEMEQRPVASSSRKKITFQLVARHVKPPVKVEKKVMSKTIQEEIQEKKVEVQKKPVSKNIIHQIVSEPVAVEMKEIPVAVQETVIKEPQPAPMLEDAEVTESDIDTEPDKPVNPVVVLAKPLYRQNQPPSYPAKARRKRQEGTVVLEVLVNPDGRVEKLQVKESSGHRILDKAAVSSVRKWVFEPGRRNGLRTAMTVLVPVRFKLQ